MIYIVLNVVFNAFILGLILLLGSGVVNIDPVIGWCLAYLIAGGLTIIGYTRLGSGIVGFFMPGRKAIGRELKKLEPLLQDVIDRTNHEYGTSYALSDFKIKISDEKVGNAFAIGYDTIMVTTGAFTIFSDLQLRAILGHEMGHLYYRDSVRSIALIFSSFTTRIIMTIYGFYLIFASIFTVSTRGGNASIMSLLSWIPVLFFLPIIVLNWIGSRLFHLLNMRMSRRAEFRADAFSASLGFKDDMISVLEVFDKMSEYDNSFISKLMSTHPASMLRIGALEDGDVAQQSMGGLFVAVPFSADNASRLGGKNSDMLRLIATLGVAGIIWSGYGVYNYMNPNKTHTGYVGKTADSFVATAIIPSTASSPATIVEKPKILKITSQYITTQVPVKQCQTVTQMVDNSNKSGVVGGIIGGVTGATAGAVAGKQVSGNGLGTIIGGVVGAVGGAFAGNQIQKSQQPNQVTQQTQKCTNGTKTVKKISGYSIEYSYKGTTNSVILKHKPKGKYLPLTDIPS